MKSSIQVFISLAETVAFSLQINLVSPYLCVSVCMCVTAQEQEFCVITNV